MFWNKQGIKFRNSEQWSYRNWFRQDKTGFGGGPIYLTSWLIDCSTDLFAMHDWFTLFLDMRLITSVHCSLTMFHDSTLSFATKVCILSYSVHSLCMLWFSYVHDIFRVFIDLLINCHDCFILSVETHFRDLEGCYGLYHTFPISNLTPEPNLIFRRPTISKTRSHT